MSEEALLLALSSVVRPTTLGAVYAMVSRPAARIYLAALNAISATATRPLALSSR